MIISSTDFSRLQLHLQSSLVHPAPDGEASSSSPCSSPQAASKPHKSQDEAWELVQKMRTSDGTIDLNSFRLLTRVGQGDIGSVFLAVLPSTSTSSNNSRDGRFQFAVKVMDKQQLKSKNKLHRIQTEREVLELLDHPFLPTLYASLDAPEYACFIMEFCPGGDLHKLRQRQPKQRFDEDDVRFYAAEVLLALEYLHMMGVVYRDLKPENVLVRDDGHIMLTDFDLSLRFDATPSVFKPPRQFRPSCISSSPRIVSCSPVPTRKLWKSSSMLGRKQQPMTCSSELKRSSSALPQLNVEPRHLRSMSFVGTHEYLAPEIIAGGGHGAAVDWWTLGIFIYELLFGRTPFRGASNDATLMNAFAKPLQFPEEIEASQEAKEMMRSLIVKDPRKRLGSARGAPDIKAHPFFEDINWALIRCNVPPRVPAKFQQDKVTAAAPV